jgi:hypothetical protein
MTRENGSAPPPPTRRLAVLSGRGFANIVYLSLSEEDESN